MTSRTLAYLLALSILASSCATGDEQAVHSAIQNNAASNTKAHATPSAPDAMQHFDLAIALHAFEHERQSAAASRRAARSRPVAAPASPGLGRGDGAGTSDIWQRLAYCESRMNGQAVGGGGKYLSYFQWLRSTWASVKADDDPDDPRHASYGRQVLAAQRLQARSGWGQWPACSRRLGLR